MGDIVLQGIQYDEKSSFQHGPALAPPLIREALMSGSMNLYAEDGRTIKDRYTDAGDYPIHDFFDIEKITLEHLKLNEKIFTLGGDHAISYPIVKALHSKYPSMDILHIDAHPDLYEEFEGDPLSHACPFARIMEANLAVRLVQVGIRAANPHLIDQANRFHVEMHEMKDWDSSIKLSFQNPLYISLDLDGIDPAYAPGVSHHEAGGLTSREVIRIIQDIDTPVIGADIVEYNPHRDYQKMTAYLAAKLLKEILVKML